MKKYLSRIIPVFIVFWIFVYNPVISPSVENPDQKDTADKKSETTAAKTGYLENILFQKLPGKERIHLVVSEQPVINVSTQADGSLLIKLENMFAPDNLRGSLGEGELANVVRVRPLQQLLEGKQFIYLTIDLKENVPYAIRQEEKNIFIDFDVSSLVEKKPVESLVVKGKNKKTAAKKEDEEKRIEGIETAGNDVQENEVKPVKKNISKLNKDRLITLDFQDADIKTVFRLMAEYGNISIISGDDVKGKVTLTIKNTPWEQALDSIIETQGLAKKLMGDVIVIMTLERKKKEENDRVSAEKDQRTAEDERVAREIKILSEKGKLGQILIEAKIVEASLNFVRNIGVTWGFTGNQSIGSYGSRVSGGTSTVQTNTWRYQYPSQITTTDSSGNPLYMAAVNLPPALASPTLGVVIGAGSAFLEAQLAALESETTGRIISAPKVVTMDGVKAIMKQGDDVPYITQSTAGGVVTQTVTFKEAVLKLEVKPRITDEGRISMEIHANNDVADYTLGQQLFGNPPIHKQEIESTVVVHDGDTVVIGGILKDTNQETVSGVPWVYKIPVLGWLFKTENITKEKTEILVFITPKILKGSYAAENTEKSIK